VKDDGENEKATHAGGRTRAGSAPRWVNVGTIFFRPVPMGSVIIPTLSMRRAGRQAITSTTMP